MARQGGSDMIKNRIAAFTQGTDRSDSTFTIEKKSRFAHNPSPVNRLINEDTSSPPAKPPVPRRPRKAFDQKINETKPASSHRQPPPPIEAITKTKRPLPPIPPTGFPENTPETKVVPDDELQSIEDQPMTPSLTSFSDVDTNTHDDSIVTVTGFNKNVTEEALKLHFENRNKSGGGPVDSVSVIDGAAVVHFKHVSDAENVLKRRQLLQRQFLTVVPFSQSIMQNMFVLFGISQSTTPELLTDFLESKTDHSVKSIQELDKGSVLVTFVETTLPVYADLQRLFHDERLDGCNLKVSRYYFNNNEYVEPLDKHVISISVEKFRFIQKYEFEEIENYMEEIPVLFSMDSDSCVITLHGKTEDMTKALNFLEKKFNKLEVSECNINRPGVYTFLKTKEAIDMLSLIETDERCTLFVKEDIYEPIEVASGSDSAPSMDTDSNPSGGSYKEYLPPEYYQASNENPTEGQHNIYGVVTKSKEYGQFQIGRCQFLVKEGSVDIEDSDCIVNMTQSEIDEGDIWTYLEHKLRDDIIRQFRLRDTEWSRKGIVVSTVSGLPCKFVIHVSLKHFGGNLSKAINKCLQTTNAMKDVTSVSFFYKTKAGLGRKKIGVEEASPMFVNAIYRLQKSSRLTVVEVRLVVDTIVESLITRMQLEIEALKMKKTRKFWRGLPSPLKVKNVSGQGSNTTFFTSTFENTSAEYSDGEQDYILDNGEAVVFICSHSQTANEKVSYRLEQLCDKHMPPKITRDSRVGKLTKQQLRELQKSAGSKVELVVDMAGCSVEMKGFSDEVDQVYFRLKCLLDAVSATDTSSPSDKQKEVEQSPLTRDKELTGTDGNTGTSPFKFEDDNDSIFGKLVANELRAINDIRKKGKAKLEIQRILYEAQT